MKNFRDRFYNLWKLEGSWLCPIPGWSLLMFWSSRSYKDRCGQLPVLNKPSLMRLRNSTQCNSIHIRRFHWLGSQREWKLDYHIWMSPAVQLLSFTTRSFLEKKICNVPAWTIQIDLHKIKLRWKFKYQEITCMWSLITYLIWTSYRKEFLRLFSPKMNRLTEYKTTFVREIFSEVRLTMSNRNGRLFPNVQD